MVFMTEIPVNVQFFGSPVSNVFEIDTSLYYKLKNNRMQFRLIFHLFFIATLALFSQCTVQKRVYQKGWYVDFHKPLKSQKPAADVVVLEQKEPNSILVEQTIVEDSARVVLTEIDEEVALVEEVSLEESYPAEELAMRTESISELPNEVFQSEKKRNESTRKAPDSEKVYWSLKMKTLLVLLFLFIVIGGAILMFMAASTLTIFEGLLLAYFGIYLFLILALIILFVMLAIPSQEAADRAIERKKQRAIDQKKQEEAEKAEQERLDQLPQEEREQEIQKVEAKKKAKSKENRNNTLIVLTIATILVALFVLLNNVNG